MKWAVLVGDDAADTLDWTQLMLSGSGLAPESSWSMANNSNPNPTNTRFSGNYCDLRGRIKGAAHTLTSRIVVRVQYGQY